jgi:hypothetical protein
MSLTFYLMLIAALALSVVLLAALAIYWHAEAMLSRCAANERCERELRQ